MSDGDKDDEFSFWVRPGRNGSRVYYERDWKPGDPPFYVIPNTPIRKRVVRFGRSGRPPALSSKEELRIIIDVTTMKEQFRDPETGIINVNKLSGEVAQFIFGKSAPIKRNEHVRQFIRSQKLAD